MADSESYPIMDDHDVPDTPEDVAVLYSWANMHGAKYRDFSASRREYRAQLRQRALEAQREAELRAAREREEVARREEETARRATAESAANHAAADEAELAVERARQSRSEAERHAYQARLAEEAAMAAEREVEEARRNAAAQAARYAESETRRRAFAGPQPTEIPGVIADPYHYAGHADPAGIVGNSGIRGAARRSSQHRAASALGLSQDDDAAREESSRDSLPSMYYTEPAPLLPYARNEDRNVDRSADRNTPSASRPIPPMQQDLPRRAFQKEGPESVSRHFIPAPSRPSTPSRPRQSAPDWVPPRHEDLSEPVSDEVYQHLAQQEMEAREREERKVDDYSHNISHSRPVPMVENARGKGLEPLDTYTEPRPPLEAQSNRVQREDAAEHAQLEHQARARSISGMRSTVYSESGTIRTANDRMLAMEAFRRAEEDARRAQAAEQKAREEDLVERTRRDEEARLAEAARLRADQEATEQARVKAEQEAAERVRQADLRRLEEQRQAQMRAEQQRMEEDARREEQRRHEAEALRSEQERKESEIRRVAEQLRKDQERRQQEMQRQVLRQEQLREQHSFSTPGQAVSPAEPPIVRPQTEAASDASRPAWLAQDSRQDVRDQPVQPADAAMSDTLQHSRERVAARWFALKDLMGGQPVLEAPAEKPQPQQSNVKVPIVAVISAAGGTGKTSMVATLGRTLSGMGEKVLLADASWQGVLPYYFGSRDLRPNTMRTFTPPAGSPDAPVCMINYESEAYDPASQDALYEDLIHRAQSVRRVLLDLNLSSVWLLRRLAGMDPVIVVPLAPDMNSMLGLQAMERALGNLTDSEGRPVPLYYVLNQFDASMPLHLDVREAMRQALGDRLLPIVIRRAPAVSEALAEGMTVMDYAPNSPVAEDYTQLATWIRNLNAPATTMFRGMRWSEG